MSQILKIKKCARFVWKNSKRISLRQSVVITFIETVFEDVEEIVEDQTNCHDPAVGPFNHPRERRAGDGQIGKRDFENDEEGRKEENEQPDIPNLGGAFKRCNPIKIEETKGDYQHRNGINKD